MTNTSSTIILLLLLGGVGAWLVKQQQDDAHEGIAESQQQKTALDAAVAEEKAEFQTLTGALILQKKAAAERSDLEAARAHLAELVAQEKTLLDQKRTVAADARRTLIGITIPNLTLNDGRNVGQAKVIKIEDDNVSFAVSTGVLRVAPRELPSDLQKRFYFDRSK